jgi:hypothetical protein
MPAQGGEYQVRLPFGRGQRRQLRQQDAVARHRAAPGLIARRAAAGLPVGEVQVTPGGHVEVIHDSHPQRLMSKMRNCLASISRILDGD